MADDLDILKTSASADMGGGVEIPAAHNEKTYDLIKTAKQELADWHVQWGKKPEKDSRADEKLAALR